MSNSIIGEPMKVICTAAKKISRLWSCERGAAAPLVGVCALMLVAAVGVAIDVGRGQVALSKLQAALDAAGLAAGAMVGQNLSEDLLQPEAEKYLNANFGGDHIHATITDFDLDLSDDNSTVTLEAHASMPTTFMHIFGHPAMEIAARTEITRETTGLEVAVVVDVTGSMCMPCTKLDSLKEAANDLLNTLFGSNETVEDLWVGIVPFSQAVNVGTSHADWSGDYGQRAAKDNCFGRTSGSNPKCPTTGNAGVIPTTISEDNPPSKPSVSTHTSTLTLVDDWLVGSPSSWYFKPHAWGGCFEERFATGRDVTDDTPDTEGFNVYFWPDMGANDWLNNGNGNKNISTSNDRSANKGCPRQAITPLTNTKSTLVDAITALQAIGVQRTHVNVGAVWGWRLLSPDWRDLWGGTMNANGLPLEYDEPLSQKAAIIMTDGMNTMTDYSAFGRVTNNALGSTDPDSQTVTTTLDNKLRTVCTNMKANGIIVYTVLFQTDEQSAKDVMKECASQEDYYFDTTTGDDLKSAFRAIGDSLSKLRVSR